MSDTAQSDRQSERQSDRQSDGARVAAIGERIAGLRAQTEALIERASEVSTQVRETRAAPSYGCNHATEVAQMRASLDAVEHELDGLRTAMLTRAVIEQAKGMLMCERHIDADAAFEALVSLSQTSHHKLVDVARTLVDAWSAGDRAHA